MIEKISISDVNQTPKMQISLNSTPIKRKQSIQEGLASSDLDNEKGFIVAFEGSDALSGTDKSVLKEVHSKLTPQAKSFIDEAYELAKENGNKEIHQIHFQYLGLQKFKEYIELLNSGDIDFDNDDDYIDIAGVFQVSLNDEIIKKEDQRTKLLPAITEQMELLENKFDELPKLGFFSKKPVLNKTLVKDIHQAFKQDTADNDGSEEFINEGDILSAAFNSSDNNINIDYTRPIIFAIQDSIMRDVLTEEDKAHIGMFDENAQKVLKNLGAKTNMFVLFEKGAKPVFMFNSIERALNSDEKFGSLTKDNSELIYLNKFANYQYLNTLINNLAKDKSKQHILLFNMDKMDDNPTIRTESLVDKLTDKLREYIKDEFNPGLKLPSNIELSKKFKVSEKTVHDAIRRLNKEGLLYIRRGQYGTIIANLSEDKNDRLYFYEKIERKLKQYIIDNCQSGDKIPTVRELSSYYHTSEKTIKKALNNLAEEGYVTFARGRNGGTYVLDIPQLNEDVYQWLAISSDYVVN